MDLCHKVIEEIFSKQGLAISVYINDSDDDALSNISAGDYIETIVCNRITGAERGEAQELVGRAIRKALYDPTDEVRTYLQRLSRTYFLLFVLKNEPKIIEFFQSMAARTVIYVGSDLLIKSLSEIWLPEDARLSTNALRVIAASGATLILAEPALEEIHTHIGAADLEFKNHYAAIEPLIT